MPQNEVRTAVVNIIILLGPLYCSSVHQPEQPLPRPDIEELECDHEDAESQVMDRLMHGYKKQVIPSKFGVKTQVEMHINDIPSINELDSSFTLDLMYSEMWTDVRLNYQNTETAKCILNITLDLDYLNRLWTPNTCIVNSKSAVIHASPNPNVFLILYADGTVWKNCRMIVRGPCEIDLRKFPFDSQSCTLVFESYSYNVQKVRLDWFKEAPLTLVKQPNLPDFTLIDTQVQRNYIEYPNGNWDQLTAKFTFKRRSGFFILQAYVPTYMTIFVAWINFWMDPRDQLATRATLGISAFLAITLQFGNILKNQPPVSYVKAMDVWMLGCISFLFFSLAELAVVSYILRNDKPRREPRKPRRTGGGPASLTVAAGGATVVSASSSNSGGSPQTQPLTGPYDPSEDAPANGTSTTGVGAEKPQPRKLPYASINGHLHAMVVYDERYVDLAYRADRISLIAFPPMFIMFNIVYWIYYVT